MNRDKSEKKRSILKRFLPQTLFGRSLLILATPVFLIQIIVTYVFFDSHWHKMTSRLAFAVAGEIVILADYVETSGDEKEKQQDVFDRAEKYLSLLVTFEEGGMLTPRKTNENSVVGGWASMIQSALERELLGMTNRFFLVDVDFMEKWVEVRIQLTGGVMNVSMPQRRMFSSTSYIFLIWIFCASIVLLLIAVLFMRNQIRPIRRLAIAAERFGKGQNVQRFKVEGAKEVRLAGKAFLDMKTRIGRQMSQRTDMLAGVSHDLRTPLTRLKLQVSMMGDSADVIDMKKDIADMEKMIEGYLNFVRGEGKENSTVVNLADLLRDVVVSAKRLGRDIDLDINDSTAVIRLREVAFKRCLSNVIGNAAKYADKIWITLNHIEDSDELEILIEDNGPGIEENLFENVFKPFYRVDSSRNPEFGGVGLGLPITMDIVHSHGGEIWLEKSQHGGLAVYIRLPM